MPNHPTVRLHREQWLIFALSACVLLFSVTWELPNQKRVELLTAGVELTPDLFERLSQLTRSYYEERDASDARTLEQLRSGDQVERYTGTEVGAVLGPDERLRAFRRYIVGSGAGDERKPYIALSRMKPSKLDLDPQGNEYGGAYLYPTGAILFLLRGIGVLDATSDMSVHLRDPSSMAAMYVSGRSLSALAVLGTSVVLALLGQALRSRTAGTLAMLTWALSTLPLNHAILSKPHTVAAFFAITATYLLLRYRAEGRPLQLALSSIAMGLAIGSTLPTAVMLLVYPVLLFEPGDWRGAFRKTVLAGVGVVLIFLVTNPYVIPSYEKYLVTITYHPTMTKSGLDTIVDYLWSVFIESYSWPLGLLGMIWALVCLVRGEDSVKRLAFVLTGVLVVVSLTISHDYTTMFIGPLLCLFAGLALDRWLSAPWGSAALRSAAVVVLFVPGLFSAAIFARDSILDGGWYEPTRAWIQEARIDENTTIGVIGRPTPKNHPPFPFVNAEIVNLKLTTEVEDAPEWVVLGNWGKRVWMTDRYNWNEHPLRDHYELAHTLGYRPSSDWLRGIRYHSESAVAGWVYRRRE